VAVRSHALHVEQGETVMLRWQETAKEGES
jgi:hypothetical protein